MPEAARYSATERLRDGRTVEIRAQRPTDQAELLAAVARSSDQSRYRRFFGAKRDFSDKEVAFFLNIDFINHVALVAVAKEKDRAAIVAGARYIVERPGTAEVAFAVIDEYQGQGLGSALLRRLTALACDAGVKEFTAAVLPDNASMLKVFEKSGLEVATRRELQAIHVVLRLA